jgi:hypothetical protein
MYPPRRSQRSPGAAELHHLSKPVRRFIDPLFFLFSAHECCSARRLEPVRHGSRRVKSASAWQDKLMYIPKRLRASPEGCCRETYRASFVFLTVRSLRSRRLVRGESRRTRCSKPGVCIESCAPPLLNVERSSTIRIRGIKTLNV